MKRVSIGLVVAFLLTADARAFPDRSAYILRGPMTHLMTSEELEQANGIETDEEAIAFIDLFWTRRDPTPGTPANELREEFDKRVALADEHFTTARTIGSMSDRGRTLILLGSPFQVTSSGAAARAEANPIFTNVDQWDGRVRGPRPDPARILWSYSHDKKPRYIRRSNFAILFVDDRGGGEYEFAKTARTNPEPILQEAIRALIVSPSLEKPPALQSGTATSFRSPALLEAYRDFRADDKTTIGPIHMTWESFVTPFGELFTPVSIYLPASAGLEPGRKVMFFGAIENARGEIIEVHEEEVALSPTRGDAYVDKSLRLAPGTYGAIFGLAEKDRIIGMTKADLRIHPLDPNESAVSPLILSNNTFALPRAQKLTDPFAFGGLKVVPKGDGMFVPSDDIWYFTEMRNPGLTPGGRPNVQVAIEIEGRTTADKDVRWKFPQQTIETIPLKGVENHYGLAMSIPLRRFHPGSYTVRIEVRDTVLERSYQLQRHFRVHSRADERNQ